MQNGGKRKEEGRMMNADSRMWKEEGGSRMQNVSAPQDSGGPHLRRCAFAEVCKEAMEEGLRWKACHWGR